MRKDNKVHEKLINALKEHSFEKLAVKRCESICYFFFTIDEYSHAFVDRLGRRKEYRHAWQVRSWLKKSFDIPEEELLVEKIKYE